MKNRNERRGEPATRRAAEDRLQAGFKLAMVLAPFLLVLALGLIEWWVRSGGP